MTTKKMSPKTLHDQLASGQDELAFLDVREHGIHAEGHPFFAVPAPLSRIELEVERLVPRKTTPVILLDQGDGEDLAMRAEKVLTGMGYADISVLDGGVMGWRDAGLELFSGVNVPSKAFGEFVEARKGTPHISAQELSSRLQAGEKIAILDSRPFDEYQRMSIPGGVDVPGAELVHRVFEVVPDETTPIVVNCAGRTRSIIGAQSLIDAGVPNPVAALENGTMGWYLQDLPLASDTGTVGAAPSAEALHRSQTLARQVAERAGVPRITGAELEAFRHEQDQRTLFILDVRTRDEYEDGHISGAQHAPGGQLVQATDEYVGVRNARLVLVDDREVRACMTAAWLRQMGWEDVSILTDFDGLAQVSGPEAGPEVREIPTLSPHELDAVLASGEPIAVLDIGPSLSYRKGHVPGARWAIRSRFDRELAFLPPVGLVIVVAEDDRLAHLAAPEIVAVRPEVIVRVLKGGSRGWKAAGLPLEEGETRHLSRPDDRWYKPYDNRDKIRERMQEYLDWETALVNQVARDGTARFRIF
ncbi:rhodanese-like domain-containing protein [Sneathiella chinensis]|uniref:Thiosulfate sulfurtransferase n=1 Tax=Sneathiella chinensis TaxID=349750 RepID=A0ABQ5U068_9PROT|nr:rhodanese-like domain-containing protein [Sneathiella chinensis]GLQ05512.1 thiosulfate sulfurtransferase [Sneathiella chinensis]